jgi:UDP-glucose 4-epimerase
MNVLVTGVNGFIGRNLIFRLKTNVSGYTLFGLDKELNEGELYLLNNQISLHRIDLLETNQLRTFIDANDFDVVFHFAGLKYARQSDQDLINFHKNNVVATKNLVEALSKKSLKKFIFSSSCSVYGPSDSILDEESELNPISHYAKNKVECEKIINEGLNNSKAIVYILRYFNIVGSEKSIPELRDKSPFGLFSNIYNSIVKGKKLEIFMASSKTSDGTCIRDYVDIRDLNSAHLKVLETDTDFKESRVNVYNLGSKNHHSSKEVVSFFAEVFDKPIEFGLKPSFSNEPSSSLASYGKFETNHSWTPKYSIKESIETFLEQN